RQLLSCLEGLLRLAVADQRRLPPRGPPFLGPFFLGHGSLQLASYIHSQVVSFGYLHHESPTSQPAEIVARAELALGVATRITAHEPSNRHLAMRLQIWHNKTS
ncbi:MAG: hypothetical protein OSB34_15925, partial [Planktomarina sp.]|nr:hypothetical protein [Planktomarina sp.]